VVKVAPNIASKIARLLVCDGRSVGAVIIDTGSSRWPARHRRRGVATPSVLRRYGGWTSPRMSAALRRLILRVRPLGSQIHARLGACAKGSVEVGFIKDAP
jgi:hypothetical protein